MNAMRISEDPKLLESINELMGFCTAVRYANENHDHETIEYLSVNIWAPLASLSYIANWLDTARHE